MIDNSLVADIYENEQPNAEIEEDEVEIEVPDFVAVGLGGGEDGFSPIVSLSKTGRVTTLEITDKNGKQTSKIYDGYSPIKGIDYIDGVDGATFTPHVSDDGALSWTNNKYLPNPEPVNIKGADGRDGATVQWHFPITFPSNVMDYNDGDIIVDVWNGYVYISNHSTGQFEFTRLVLQGEQGDKGVGVETAYIKEDGELIIALSDGNEIRAGYIVPEKGIDYFTEADKKEMIESVISALPKYTGEVESV